MELTLDLLSVDRSNPPGDTGEVVGLIEAWLEPLDVETLRDRFCTRKLDIDAQMQPILAESVEYYAPMMGETYVRSRFTSPSIRLEIIEGETAINSVPESARDLGR